jgi:drug/metabolite transporter (DMT)-like permease
MMQLNNNILGIIYKLLNCFCFAVMSLIIAEQLAHVPPQQLLFLRASISSVLCLIIAQALRLKLKLPKNARQIKLYLWRALINLAAMAAWVEGLKRMHINDATALAYLGPVWVMLVAPIIFTEKLTKRHVLIVLLNLLAVFAILQPNWLNLDYLGLCLVLLSTALWVAYEVICKKQAITNEHYILQALFNFTFCSILMLPFITLLPWQALTFSECSSVIIFSALGILNVVVLFLAYVYAPLTVLAPFSYSRLLFTVIFSFVFYKTLPSYGCLLGAAIIIATNVYTARVEAALQK